MMSNTRLISAKCTVTRLYIVNMILKKGWGGHERSFPTGSLIGRALGCVGRGAGYFQTEFSIIENYILKIAAAISPISFVEFLNL